MTTSVDKLAEMQAPFMAEPVKYNVLHLDDPVYERGLTLAGAFT